MGLETGDSTVAIIGAGPVGLYTALYLAKAGIDATLFEALDEPLRSPRAMAYLPIVLEDFAKSGILEDIKRAGYVNTTGIAWRKPGGEILAAIQGHADHPIIHIGQDEVADIILDHLKHYPNITIKFKCRLKGLEQGSDGVRSRFQLESGDEIVHFSKYLVGADGGKSTVRKLLDIPLEGHTWQDFNIVAANLDYDVEKEAGWGPASFVVDPRFWAVVARVNRGRVLRVASGEQLDECVPDGGDWDKEAAICRLRKRLAKILPGSENAVILNISPYRTHQRVVPNYVMGNVALAGDAAHLTNPTGGLGLTTGFLDAALLGRTLIRILKDGAPSGLLVEYAEKRREAFVHHTDPVATQNRKRLLSTAPEDVMEREQFFEKLNSVDILFLVGLGQREAQISSTVGVE